MIEKICYAVQDILKDPMKQNRHAVLALFNRIVFNQFDKLGLLRYYFFKIIKNHDNHEDFDPRLVDVYTYILFTLFKVIFP